MASSVVYSSWTAITIAPEGLVSSSTRVAGVESAVISNTSTLYDDVVVAGKTTTGTSPTVSKVIEVWAWAAYGSGPTYPDVLDGTSSAETMTSENVKVGALKMLWSQRVDATSDRTYFMPPTSIAQKFGYMPEKWGLFYVHDTVAATHATAGNHEFQYQGITHDFA